MSSQYVLITVVICALCTQVTRWLPFLCVWKKKGASPVGTLSGSRSSGSYYGGAGGLLPEGNYTPSLPVWPAGAS